MKKLTLVLVVLLLALACVFVACGKKNETPVDNTDPKPVDDNPTTAPVETVTVEDMTPVAEQFKKDLADNYVDLYSKEVENAIDAEKAAALLKIMGASSKDEAQKIADEFFAFLKAQKTSYDVLKDLVAEIGDVALADEDLIKEAAAYNKALDEQFAGNNAAKKAVLDAYKADKDTQKAVADASTRLAALKEAKAIADAKKGETIETADMLTTATTYNAVKALLDTGVVSGTAIDGKFDTDSVNLLIAALKEDFTDEDKKGFNLVDINAYEAKLQLAADIAAIYKIEVGSDAYNEIFDVATLAECKVILDAAVAADTLLQDMKAVVDAAAALKAAAEEARWKEYVYVDGEDLKATSTGAYTLPVTVDGVAQFAKAVYATEAAAEEADVENITKVEDGSIALDYKLALKADVEAAKNVLNKLKTNYSNAKLTAYGYNKPGDVVAAAEATITTIAGNYATSVGNALTGFASFPAANYVDVVPTKEATIDVWTGFTSNPKASAYLTNLAKEIDDLKATFKTVDADGNELSYGDGMVTELGYVSTGDYAVDGTHKVFLVNGKPAIKFVAYTYSYELDGKALGATTEFNALAVLKATDNNATKAKAALKWLEMYIGEGDYADVYDFTEYKAYAAGFNGVKLYMTDRAVTEVAKAETVKIDGKAVATEKTAAVEAKVYSPYTIAKALVAEQKKIDDAKAEALETIKAAALALRTAGDANAITEAAALYSAIVDGSYLNEKLYEDDAAEAYLGKALAGEKVVVFEKTAKEAEVKVNISALIGDASTALTAVQNLASANTSAVALKYGTMGTYDSALKAIDAQIALYDLYIANAKAAYDAAVAGNALSTYLVADGAVTAAKNAYTAVDQIKNLLLNKTVFDDANSGNKYVTLTTTVGTNNTENNWGAIHTVIKDFAPKDDGEKVTATTKNALELTLAQIGAGTKDARNTIAAALKTATDNFEEEFDAFKAYDIKASDARTDADQIKAALTAIKTFVDNNKADYINLAYTEEYGDKVITFADPLTEVYRERLLAGNYDVVGAAVAYAGQLDTDNSLTTVKKALDTDGTPNTWKAAAQTRVDAQDVVLEAVTSIKAANEIVKNYALDDGVYDLDTALSQINKALTDGRKTAIELKDLKAGIVNKGYTW